MHWLVETALANAVAAAVLAVVVLALSRRVRSSALTHALWVLVLVKLVTPPLIELPIPVEVAELESVAPVSPNLTEPPAVLYTEVTAAGVPQPPLEADVLESPAEPPQVQPVASSETGVSSEAPAAVPAFMPAEPVSGAPITPDWLAWLNWSTVFRLALTLWAVVSVLVAAILAARFARFVRLLRSVGATDPEVQQEIIELAGAAGLDRVPPIVLVPWTCSPMLWGCGRAARLLFPAALWDELDHDAREALLLHELAHYRRGDHWVRLLELAATILYWWHPVVWFGRRQIAIAEEECCDAWAVERFTDRPRVYADALLATLDFVAERRPALPPAACGIGELPVLRRRLTQIMRRSVQRSLGTGGRWCLIILAAVALPLHPVLALLPVSSADAALTMSLTRPDLLGDAGEIALPRSTAPVEQLGSGEVSTSPRSAQSAPPATPAGWWDARPSQRWAAASAPGGRFRLVAEVEHRVWLERLDDSRRFDLGPAKLSTAAFLPGGSQFVAGALDGTVRLWDAASGEPASLFGPHGAAVRAVAVSADGRWAISGAADGSVFVWEVASGRIAHAWSEPAGRPIVSVAFAPDGGRIAIASGGWQDSSSEITLLETNDWKEIGRFAAPSIAVVEFARDGSLFSADWSGRLLRWEPQTAQAEPWGLVDKEFVSAARFSSGNSVLDPPQL